MPLRSDKTRLFLTAAVIAACIGIGIFLLETIPNSQRSALPKLKWIRFVGVSTFVFWYIFASYRGVHKSIRFWTSYVLTLMFHIVVIGHFHNIYAGGISTVTLLGACIGEFVFMMILMQWALGTAPNRVDLTVGRGRVHNTKDKLD